MQRILAIKESLFVLLLFFSFNASAQHYVSVKSGLNISRSNGDRTGQLDDIGTGFRFGLGTALEYRFLVKNKLFFETGLSYYQRGYSFETSLIDETGRPIGSGKTKINYDYLGISTRVGLQTSGKASVGISIGVLESALVKGEFQSPISESFGDLLPKDEVKGDTWVRALEKPFSRFDLGLELRIEIGVAMGERAIFVIDISAYQGLTPFNVLRNSEVPVKLKHYSGYLGLGLRFDLGNGVS